MFEEKQTATITEPIECTTQVNDRVKLPFFFLPTDTSTLASGKM